ncbi:MAG: hypothetical protein BJ554DRAFT_2797, partial [Olpidium bornovanus]
NHLPHVQVKRTHFAARHRRSSKEKDAKTPEQAAPANDNKSATANAPHVLHTASVVNTRLQTQAGSRTTVLSIVSRLRECIEAQRSSIFDVGFHSSDVSVRAAAAMCQADETGPRDNGELGGLDGVKSRDADCAPCSCSCSFLPSSSRRLPPPPVPPRRRRSSSPERGASPTRLCLGADPRADHQSPKNGHPRRQGDFCKGRRGPGGTLRGDSQGLHRGNREQDQAAGKRDKGRRRRRRRRGGEGGARYGRAAGRVAGGSETLGGRQEGKDGGRCQEKRTLATGRDRLRPSWESRREPYFIRLPLFPRVRRQCAGHPGISSKSCGDRVPSNGGRVHRQIMRAENTRLAHEKTAMEEKIKENQEKIKLNRQLPYLVGNVVELMDMDPNDEPEEDGANVDLDAHRKGKCAVIKTSTRQVDNFLRIFACFRHCRSDVL